MGLLAVGRTAPRRGCRRASRVPGVLHGVLCTCDKNLFHSDIDPYRELYYVRVCAAGERLYFFSGWRLTESKIRWWGLCVNPE